MTNFFFTLILLKIQFTGNLPGKLGYIGQEKLVFSCFLVKLRTKNIMNIWVIILKQRKIQLKVISLI